MPEADAEFADAIRELPPHPDQRSLALVGFMGIGKTTVGDELSRRLGWPLVDTDSEVETRSNKTIREIFDWFGEPRFRELEHDVIAAETKKDRRVLSLGGGSFVQANNRELLLRHCTVVYMAAPWSYIARHVQRLRNTRPLLRGRSPAELQQLLVSRHPFYDQAHVRVAVPGRGAVQVAGRILELLGLG
ncbi:MAG TPA: shikimate kinase [Chloroflexota bacterium]